jgi:magnesium chelatase family protein
LEVSMIASLAGEIEGGALTNLRPFRSPHNSALPALVGGGLRVRPGEISLAHNGVLFLDEFPEFAPQALDSLRQPLEMGEVAIFPRASWLVAAMNDPGFAFRPRAERALRGGLPGATVGPAARSHRFAHRGAHGHRPI